MENEITNFLKNKKILLVEDYPTNRELILFHLKELGLIVEVAENGKQALELFKIFNPDLILMDIQMPEMDGFEATKLIRKENNGDKIPIIGLTASINDLEITNYIEKGFNDILTKPFKKENFIKIFIKWMKNYNENINVIYSKESDDNNNLPIDITKNLETLGGNKEFFDLILNDFLKNIKIQIKKLYEAFEKNDITAFEKEAHKIKGVTLILMAYPLSKIAAELEKMGLKKDIAGAKDLLLKLEISANELEKFITNYYSKN